MHTNIYFFRNCSKLNLLSTWHKFPIGSYAIAFAIIDAQEALAVGTVQILAIVRRLEAGQKAEGPTVGHTGGRTAGARIELTAGLDHRPPIDATAGTIDAALGGYPALDGAAIELSTTQLLGIRCHRS